MRIKKVIIEEGTQEKILRKHNVKVTEIEEVLLQSSLVLKSKWGRYTAIGYHQRYLTIVFEYNEGVVEIITAYPSSEKQIKYLKNKQ